MNKGIIASMSFIGGTVIGFFVGKKFLEQHYNQVIQNEVESVKEAFRKYSKACTPHKEEASDADISTETQNVKTDKKDYRVYCNRNNVHEKSYSNSQNKQNGPKKGIYVIAPNEFDTVGYETISLKSYSNGVIADDDGEIMTEEEIENTITHESLNHFGEYESDSVFVRNDYLQVDYEILAMYSEHIER